MRGIKILRIITVSILLIALILLLYYGIDTAMHTGTSDAALMTLSLGAGLAGVGLILSLITSLLRLKYEKDHTDK